MKGDNEGLVYCWKRLDFLVFSDLGHIQSWFEANERLGFQIHTPKF